MAQYAFILYRCYLGVKTVYYKKLFIHLITKISRAKGIKLYVV